MTPVELRTCTCSGDSLHSTTLANVFRRFDVLRHLSPERLNALRGFERVEGCTLDHLAPATSAAQAVGTGSRPAVNLLEGTDRGQACKRVFSEDRRRQGLI